MGDSGRSVTKTVWGGAGGRILETRQGPGDQAGPPGPEGLGEGMQLSKHISLRAKKKEAKDSHSIKKQAQRVIHVHDSWPFLLTSSSPVVFIFVQHLLNQVPR